VFSMENRMLVWGQSSDREKILSRIRKIQALDASVQVDSQMRDRYIQFLAEERPADAIELTHVVFKHEIRQAVEYGRMLDEIRYGKLFSCDIASLCALHKRLFSQYDDAGSLSKIDNGVHTFDEDGTATMTYHAAPANMKAGELEWAFDMYARAVESDSELSLAYAVCLVEHIFKIHPFSDGNGRTSRIMLVSEMKRMGFECAADMPFEVCYKKFRRLVCLRCNQVDKGKYSREIVYGPFVELMFDLIELSYKKLRDGALA